MAVEANGRLCGWSVAAPFSCVLPAEHIGPHQMRTTFDPEGPGFFVRPEYGIGAWAKITPRDPGKPIGYGRDPVFPRGIGKFWKRLWCNGCYGHHWTWRRLMRCG